MLFAVIDKPGRATAEVLAEAIPAIIRAFPWPKSMRWGTASQSTASLRWVRPLQGIVALLGDDVVDCEIDGIHSGAATVGHRFHHPGIITIGSAHDYVEKLRACHVIVSHEERQQIIRDGAAKAAATAGLSVIPDEGLVQENAGLTEYPVPLLGHFDPAFLEVPREVIQLTMRTNQKYFALTDSSGKLAPNFICTANIEPTDGGTAIAAGNAKVLAARLSDAKFFWEQDLKVPLEEQATKLAGIVFHEKLGTVADKVDRVAKLARWLVEEGIVALPLPPAGEGRGEGPSAQREAASPEEEGRPSPNPLPQMGEGYTRGHLADLAEQAARLCKADLVTGMVGEFPELQGVMGGYYARAQGLDPQVADAIRDHYKPVGQGDDVPTAPVTVAVSLADKLDTLVGFFGIDELPTGSRDPFALRRAALGTAQIILERGLRGRLLRALHVARLNHNHTRSLLDERERLRLQALSGVSQTSVMIRPESSVIIRDNKVSSGPDRPDDIYVSRSFIPGMEGRGVSASVYHSFAFIVDRLKVQQREAGVRHDLIDAVFALGGEDDLVRLLARVKALQAFVASDDGANLLTGYKRAANILKKEGWDADQSSAVIPAEAGISLPSSGDQGSEMPASAGMTNSGLSYTPENEEAALIAALDAAEERAGAAIDAEDFEGAMAALVELRAPIDAFFDKVTVNDPDRTKRKARLALLARIRDAVHTVADFSRIEG